MNTHIDEPHAASYKHMGAEPMDKLLQFPTPIDRRLFQLGLQIADERTILRKCAWEFVYRGYAAGLSGSSIDCQDAGGGYLVRILGIISPIAATMVYRREFGDDTGPLEGIHRWLRCSQNAGSNSGDHGCMIEDGRFRENARGKIVGIGGSHRATVVGHPEEVTQYTTRVETTKAQSYKLPAQLMREWADFLDQVKAGTP